MLCVRAVSKVCVISNSIMTGPEKNLAEVEEEERRRIFADRGVRHRTA